jgi:hypothetical protein
MSNSETLYCSDWKCQNATGVEVGIVGDDINSYWLEFVDCPQCGCGLIDEPPGDDDGDDDE